MLASRSVSVATSRLPRAFAVASAVGLTAFGFTTWFSADHAVLAPNLPGVVSAVHVAMLGFLTTGMVGLLYRMLPAAAGRAPRSPVAGWATFVLLVAGAWLLPSGFAHGAEAWVLVGGGLVAAGVALLVWNVWPLLGNWRDDRFVAGSASALGYLVLTVAFGLVYAADRQTGWFSLLPHRVLAHAHLGLLGWLGIAAMAMSGPGVADARAVALVEVGVVPLALGLLFAAPPLAVAGGGVVLVGLALHLAAVALALGGLEGSRRTALLAASELLLLAVGLGVLAGIAPVSTAVRMKLVAAEVASLVGWVGVTMLGAGEEARRPAARAAPVLLGLGTAVVVAGLLGGAAPVLAVGGVIVATGGAAASWGVATPEPRRQRPVNVGVRFSRKAEAASR